jgi:hypothetical protein
MKKMFVEEINSEQFSYVQALPARITGADARDMALDPLRIYALRGDMVMAYLEYSFQGERIQIDWIANWGDACDCQGLDNMLLHHACSMWDASMVSNVFTNVTIRKNDPTLLCAFQMNTLYENGFVMTYWTGNDHNEISLRMNRKVTIKTSQ